nr:acyl-protein thioesterase 1 [Quercus suber]
MYSDDGAFFSSVDETTKHLPHRHKKDKMPKEICLAYPDPFIVPARDHHKQSLMLLHGRGSNGEKFGLQLLRSKCHASDSPSGTEATLQDAFPNMKFIFPTAKKRRAKWYKRALIAQWFDSVPIDEQDDGVSKDEEEWQLDGLRETGAFLKSVLDCEVDAIGAGNVFIGGLSQGCAMSLHVLLSYQGWKAGGDTLKPEALGGFVGMSGWLPFAKDVADIIIHPTKTGCETDDNDLEEDDPFARSDGSEDEEELFDQPRNSLSAATDVCNLVRDNMDLPPLTDSQPLCLETAVFLGHGTNDEKVKIEKGVQIASLLKDVGFGVTWRTYDEGHWYKVPEEIDDIAAFLKDRINRG